MKFIAVSLHPILVDQDAIKFAAVAVIDVLRATTTIAHALAAGARDVVVCGEVEEAKQRAKGWWQCGTVLGGEREGLKIDGFQLGNSPTEYTPATVAGRAVFFTTTNGTRAFLKCREARRVFAASLVNRQAVVEALADERLIHIVCAGTRGEVTREDALAAGAIVRGLIDQSHGECELDDEAAIVCDAWDRLLLSVADASAESLDATLLTALRNSHGGRNLIEIGMDADIVASAQLDKIKLVGELDAPSMSLRVR